MNQLNQELHNTDSSYGSQSWTQLAKALNPLTIKGNVNSLLDYGCGKGSFISTCQKIFSSRVKIYGYDPGNKDYEKLPEGSFDLVTSLQVLEHLEHHEIEETLSNIRRKTKKVALLVVDLKPAKKTLADGRNAHIMLAPPEWWLGKVYSYFGCISTVTVNNKLSNRPSAVIFSCTTDLINISLSNSILNAWLTNYGVCKSKELGSTTPIEKDASRLARLK